MPTISFQYDTDAERLELERAAAYVTEGQERLLWVDDPFGRAGIGDGRVERRREADPAVGLPQDNRPASEVMWPAVNSATSSRRRTLENETGGVVRYGVSSR